MAGRHGGPSGEDRQGRQRTSTTKKAPWAVLVGVLGTLFGRLISAISPLFRAPRRTAPQATNADDGAAHRRRDLHRPRRAKAGIDWRRIPAEFVAAVRLRPRMLIKPVAVVCAVSAAVTGGFVLTSSSAFAPDKPPGKELSLAASDEIDRGLEDVASRSKAVRASNTTQVAELEISNSTNSSIALTWANPHLKAGDRVFVRRVEGPVATKDPTAGVDVPLESATSTAAVDAQLPPDATYSYSVFIERSGKPAAFSTSVTAATRNLTNHLKPGDVLLPGQKLVSANGHYQLVMSSAGDLLLRDNKGNRLWSTFTYDVPGATATMQEDGNLVVGLGNKTEWSTKTSGTPGAMLTLTDKGDIQVAAGQDTLWSRRGQGNAIMGDDYPFADGGGTTLGYAARNCTDFAAWRLNEQSGVTKAPWKYTSKSMTPGGGDAKQWASFFPDKTDQKPALGAVAWWASGGQGHGHVAIVSAIYEDGSITIEEYNYTERLAYGTRHLEKGSQDWPEAFIHIADL